MNQFSTSNLFAKNLKCNKFNLSRNEREERMLEKVKPNFADNIWRPMNQSGLLGVSMRFIKQDPPWNCCCSGDLDFPRHKGSKGEVPKPSAFSLSLSPSKYFFILVFVSVYLSSYKYVTSLCPALSLSFSSKNKFKTDLDFPSWEKQNKKTLIIQTQIQNKPWSPKARWQYPASSSFRLQLPLGRWSLSWILFFYSP